LSFLPEIKPNIGVKDLNFARSRNDSFDSDGDVKNYILFYYIKIK
jgi:hypothetical protein